MKAELWFYIGPGRFFDKIIRWVTRSKYSHVAIVVDPVLVVNGVCGTAYQADAWAGKVTKESTGNYNLANWERVPVTLRYGQDWLVQQVGEWYDYPGAICCGLGIRIGVPSWWYCSEFAADAMGFLETSVSPQRLRELIK